MRKDEVAIRATLESLNAACAKRDIHAFMELFEDSDTLSPVFID